jgi:hypothetical protein
MKSYKHYYCGLCEKKLTHGDDLILYNQEVVGDEVIITELEFRHQNQRDSDGHLIGGCDDKRFRMSRHVRDGFSDLLERWGKSPYNKETK